MIKLMDRLTAQPRENSLQQLSPAGDSDQMKCTCSLGGASGLSRQRAVKDPLRLDNRRKWNLSWLQFAQHTPSLTAIRMIKFIVSS